MAEVSGEFVVRGWDEQPWDERAEAGRLTRAEVTMEFDGGVEATATVQWLMAYAADGASARYVGLQRMAGRVGDRRGSFVLESAGDYVDGVARGTLRVVPGSGTGELAGLAGEGTFEAPQGSAGTFRLEIAD
jgi:hypothetical protein